MSDQDRIIPAYLGWGNVERDKVGMRLYATDAGDSPRWDASVVGGRVAEHAIVERFGHAEGTRFLIVNIGTRFLPDERMAQLVDAINELLEAP